MREFNVLSGYGHSATPRIANRTIKNRLAASYRDREFFDGKREDGYGGYVYDGTWQPIAERFCKEYQLNGDSAVLQIQCEKGHLLHELLKLHPLMRVRGMETSIYARNNGMPDIRLGIRLESPTIIPFARREFDLVIAIGAVYTLSLPDAMKALREIGRVGKQAFITLGAYESEHDYWLLRKWSLLGTTILTKAEWREVLKHVGYEGDYSFVTAKTLNLCESSSQGPVAA